MSDFSALLPKAIEGLVHDAANTVVARQQEALLPVLEQLKKQLHEVTWLMERLLEQGGASGGEEKIAAAVRDMSERIAHGNRQNRAGFEDIRALAKVYSDRLEAKLQLSNVATGAASNVASEKLIAYLATEYCLGYNPEEVVLKIGKHSASLAELFTEHRVSCGAFITAYNPEGTQQSDEANAQDHAALLQRVVELGHSFIEGVGAGTTGQWPLERSVFAYGMDKASACAVGRQFRQDAIVWVGPDAVPQLVLLR